MPSSKRVQELEAKIAEISKKVEDNKSLLRTYIRHSRVQGQALPDYAQHQLAANSQRIESILGQSSPLYVYEWNDPRWDAWNVELVGSKSSLLESFVRVGRLVAEDGFTVPALAGLVGSKSTIVIQTDASTATAGSALMQSMIMRIALMLPHQASYTLLDPAGSGLAFPMQKSLPRVTMSSGDVRRDLEVVAERVARIIREYVNAQVASFEQVPSEKRINETYRFVFAADFPNQYDRRAIEALQNIANNGPAAGTYVILHHNRALDLPRDISMDGFKKAHVITVGDTAKYTNLAMKLDLDGAPPADMQVRLFQKIAQSKPPERLIDWDSVVGIKPEDWWTSVSARTIETPIGVHGSSNFLGIYFGADKDREKSPCAHGLLGAMTGSGKSTLYHVLIAGLAVRYSPEQIRLYLVDGKAGVEFAPYRDLPHAEVVALRSTPELSRSVLRELLDEMTRRYATFISCGVNDLDKYCEMGSPRGVLPRILLLVDEYQELFEGDREGGASANLLQLAQQGRGAGIHMLLASQRFGAVGLQNQTGVFGNFHLRMAMQMAASDIAALTEFGREGKNEIAGCDLPGKIVVNAAAGADGANKSGKVAYLSIARRTELIQMLGEKAKLLPSSMLPRQVVFMGSAQPKLADNPFFKSLLEKETWPQPEVLASLGRSPVESGGLGIDDWYVSEQPRVAWIGQQFNVRGHATVVFRRRVTQNMLIVGSANAARYGMLSALLTCLAVNSSPDDTRFVIFDRSSTGTEWAKSLETTHASVLEAAGFVSQYSRDAKALEGILESLIQELERRRALSDEELSKVPSVFIAMTELDAVESARRKVDAYGGTSDSTVGVLLRRLSVEGAPLGMHLILSFQGSRAMTHVIDSRRGLDDFRHRVALQMSEDESFIFVRKLNASRLQSDGPTPTVALYVDVENDKMLRFKPYSAESMGTTEPAETFLSQLREFGKRLSLRRTA